jgi:hypothetical protein
VSDAYNVWNVWGPAVDTLWTAGKPVEIPPNSFIRKDQQSLSEIGCFDPRWSGLGIRVVLPAGKTRMIMNSSHDIQLFQLPLPSKDKQRHLKFI